MFINKQFRNFVHSKSVYSVFRDCIFEVTRVNSVQISFSILEISPKKCVAHLKLDWVRSNRNAKDFSRKCRQIVYCVKTAFCWKIACYKVLQSLPLCIPLQLLQREMCCIEVVEIF